MESESLPELLERNTALLGGWSGHLGLLLAEAHLPAGSRRSVLEPGILFHFLLLS